MSSLHLARLLALAAIFIWASLAALGVKLAHLLPFLLVGLTLAEAGIASLPTRRSWRVPVRTFALGTGGLFGYHFFLFLAFRNAPAIEANLINYLWPLLIVLLSPFLFPGLRLGLPHMMAGFAGFVGAALVVSKGRLAFEADYLLGYLAAVLAAFLWAGYSLATSKLPPFPTAAVGGFCLASGALSLLQLTRSNSLKAIVGIGSGNEMVIGTSGLTDLLFQVNGAVAGRIDSAKNKILHDNGGAKAVGDTTGYVWLPYSLGKPTGTPVGSGTNGAVPLAIDLTNNKLHFWTGAAWVSSPAPFV